MLSSVGAAMEAATRLGTVVSVDASAGRIVLDHDGTPVAYVVPQRAVIMLAKQTANLDQFAAGAKVTVRFRVEAAEPHTVYDLTDAATWPWLSRMRRQITGGRIASADETGITLEDNRDRGRLHYRVTDKTHIEVGGVPAGLSALKPDMTVFVAPRLLPNGQTMASAIADTEVGAARLRERTMPTVTGTIIAVRSQDRSIELHTRADDRRSLKLADPCLVRRDGKDVPVSQLRAGMWVTAHVRRVGMEETVVRVTIGKKPAANPRKGK